MLEYRAREQCSPLRALYWQYIRRFTARQIVFFDETHAKPNDLRRKYGLSLRGLPAFMYVNSSAHGVGTGTCGMCAISLRGMLSTTVTTERVNNLLFMQTLEHEVYFCFLNYNVLGFFIE